MQTEKDGDRKTSSQGRMGPAACGGGLWRAVVVGTGQKHRKSKSIG